MTSVTANHPDVYEAFEQEYVERQALSEQLAAEAAAAWVPLSQAELDRTAAYLADTLFRLDTLAKWNAGEPLTNAELELLFPGWTESLRAEETRGYGLFEVKDPCGRFLGGGFSEGEALYRARKMIEQMETASA
jgi:hypothetical protein